MSAPKSYFGLKGYHLGVLISWVAGLDFFLFGYDQGVTGGLLDLLSFTKYFPEIDLTAADPGPNASTYQGIAVASYNLGSFFGAIICVFIGNPLGRRRTIFLGCFIVCVGAILQTSSYQLPQWITGRIVTGIGNGLNTSTIPMYQSEVSASHQRGKLVMVEGMLITAGVAVAYWLNYGLAWIGDQEVAWRFPLAFQMAFAIPIMATIMFLPESPRWLVMKGREEEAREVLQALADAPADDPQLVAEFEDVKETVAEMSKGSFRDLFEMTDQRELHRVILACAIQMMQQISGINLITYYAPTLYGQIGLDGNNYPKLLAACNGTEYLLAAFIPIFIIERVGRRPLMLFGAAGMSLSMAVLAGTNYGISVLGNADAGYTQAAFLFVFNTFFAIGWLGMTWLYPAEIVPLRIRAPTNALSTSTNWIFNFMVVMISPVSFDSIGYKTYIIFAVINFAMVPAVYFLYPETRLRSLEEMDGLFAKSRGVFDIVKLSITEPHKYDKEGKLRVEYVENAGVSGQPRERLTRPFGEEEKVHEGAGSQDDETEKKEDAFERASRSS